MEDLIFSARKKRKVPEIDDDETILTPKKARLSHATPAKATHATPGVPPSSSKSKNTDLPEELKQIISIHTALEQAMSAALATAQISPDPDTGRVPSVINHLSFQERGLGVRMSVEDLQKLCWLWEWDGETIPKGIASHSATTSSSSKKKRQSESALDDDSDTEGEVMTEDPQSNPFLTKPPKEDRDNNPFLPSSNTSNEVSKEWMRGGFGFCINPTTHVTRLDKSSPTKRVPAYGIGIEVEWSQEDVAGRRVGGMSAVARWTGAANRRKHELRERLETWMTITSKLNGSKYVPVPLADLPPLAKPPTVSKLAHLITPRKLTFPTTLPTPLKALMATPSSSRKEPIETPSKDSGGFMIPFPVVPGERPVTPHGPRPGEPSSGSSGIVTPSSGRSRGLRTPSFGKAAAKLAAAYTPTSDGRTTPTSDGRTTPTTGHRGELPVPVTPTTTNSSVPNTVETPMSARRASLYERMRAKSESEGNSVKKTAITASVRSAEKQSQEKVVMVGPEALRRRAILSRLPGIADAVWMLFSATGSSGALLTSSSRKRRALERGEVIRAVVKSSKGPLSEAEATESLTMLCELCPFFLQSKVIGGENWLEMPASSGPSTVTSGSPSPRSPSKTTTAAHGPPGSPNRRPTSAARLPGSPSKRQVIEEELLNRSPKRVKKEEGGIRDVHERIRRELQVYEDDPFI